MDNGKNICVYIRSTQKSKDNGTDSIEFYTEGKYYIKGASHYITYKESEISGMEGTTSTIKVEPDAVTLIRTGSISSKLIFKKSEATVTTYGTQFGCFDMIISTEDINVDANHDGEYRLHLKYALEIHGLGATANELMLSFKN